MGGGASLGTPSSDWPTGMLLEEPQSEGSATVVDIAAYLPSSQQATEPHHRIVVSWAMGPLLIHCSRTGKVLCELPGGEGCSLTTYELPGDGTPVFAAGTARGAIAIYHGDTFQPLSTVNYPDPTTSAPQIQALGEEFVEAAGGGGESIPPTTAPAPEGQAAASPRVTHLLAYHDAADGDGGARLVAVSLYRRMQVLDGRTGALLRWIDGIGEDEYIQAAKAFTPAATSAPRVVLGGSSGGVWVCDPRAGRVLRRVEGHDMFVLGLALLPAPELESGPGRPLVVSAGYEGRTYVWPLDEEEGEGPTPPVELPGIQDQLMCVAVYREPTQGRDRVVAAGSAIYVHDVATLTLVRSFRTTSGAPVTRLFAYEAAVRGGIGLVSVSTSEVYLWDPEAGTMLRRVEEQQGLVITRVAFFVTPWEEVRVVLGEERGRGEVRVGDVEMGRLPAMEAAPVVCAATKLG
jgi:hypothetical protein